MDELDRILSAERSITPSPGFTDVVMRAVRREAATPPPIPFPWRRMLPIIAATAALLVAALPLALVGPAAGGSPFAGSATLEHLLAVLAAPLGYVALALLGSLLAVRLSTRLSSI